MADELNIFQRMNAVQRKVSYVQKEKGGDLKYAIVTHDRVTALLRPHCVEVGIVYYPSKITVLGHESVLVKTKFGERIEHRHHVHVTCRFVCTDNPLSDCYVEAIADGFDSGDKGPGKAISYGVKMCLLKAFGLETGEGEESEYDQEDRYKAEDRLAPEEKFIREFEGQVAMSTTIAELNAIGKSELAALQKNRDWKARANQAVVAYNARKVEILKAEAQEEEMSEAEIEAEESGFPGDRPTRTSEETEKVKAKVSRAKAKKSTLHPASGD
jgi:hypothetical protein